jgi:hypothetical protein
VLAGDPVFIPDPSEELRQPRLTVRPVDLTQMGPGRADGQLILRAGDFLIRHLHSRVAQRRRRRSAKPASGALVLIDDNAVHPAQVVQLEVRRITRITTANKA